MDRRTTLKRKRLIRSRGNLRPAITQNQGSLSSFPPPSGDGLRPRPRPVGREKSLSHGGRSLSFAMNDPSHAGFNSSPRSFGSSVRVLSRAVFSHHERTSGGSGASDARSRHQASLSRSTGFCEALRGSGLSLDGEGGAGRSCGFCGAETGC